MTAALNQALDRLESVLQARAPAVLATFRVELTEEEIRATIATAGMECPEVLVAWWKRFGGPRPDADTRALHILPGLQSLSPRLSVGELRDERHYAELAGNPWSATWLPLFAPVEGSVLVVDLAQPHDPPLWNAASIDGRPPTSPEEVAPTLAQFVSDAVTWLEGSECRHDPELGMDSLWVPIEAWAHRRPRHRFTSR